MEILTAEQIDKLAEKSWFMQTDFLATDLCRGLQADFLAHQADLQQASVGRGNVRSMAQDIRTDSTVWLTGETPAQNEFFAVMDRIRQQLNQDLFLGLATYEAHYARYQAGGFYKKHLDSFEGKRNRIVSTVLYLTPDWQETDQGHLVLYDPVNQDQQIGQVLPQAGTLACFMSEEIPHEVLPPARERISIAGWFRA